MKKLLVVLLVLCASGGASAQSPTTRTVVKEYTFLEPRYGPGELGFRGIWQFKFKPEPGERWVSISIEDMVVENVPALMFQFTSTSHPFCSSMTKPVRIVTHKPVVVRVGRGSCETPHVWGTGTHIKGTVTATFER